MQPSSFPGTLLPPPGTAAATARRNAFIHDILDICGDVRLLWLPSITDTTTTTDASKNARVFTYDATIASRISVLGSGVQVSFNGTDQEADVPANTDFTFGDSATDGAFSIFALLNQTATTGIKTILSNYDLTTGATKKEWWFYLDATEKLVFQCYDDSAGKYIGYTYNTALADGSNLFVAGTYDGSALVAGIKLYSAAAALALTDASSATYVAMESKVGKVRLGMTYGTAAQANFFSGSMGLVVLCAKELSAADLWAIKAEINAFYGLAL